MAPVEFPEMTATLAKHQPEYLPLPVWMDETTTVSQWKLSWWDRLVAMFVGRMWLCQLNFGEKLQPQRPSFTYPFEVKSSSVLQSKQE